VVKYVINEQAFIIKKTRSGMLRTDNWFRVLSGFKISGNNISKKKGQTLFKKRNRFMLLQDPVIITQFWH